MANHDIAYHAAVSDPSYDPLAPFDAPRYEPNTKKTALGGIQVPRRPRHRRNAIVLGSHEGVHQETALGIRVPRRPRHRRNAVVLGSYKGLHPITSLQATYHANKTIEQSSQAGTTSTLHACASKTQKPKSYQWLSKSSKRRVRKAIQKLKTQEPEAKLESIEESAQPETEGIGEASKSDSEAEREYMSQEAKMKNQDAEGLAQWRKRKLQEGTDPFSCCYGKWHVFGCGHLISVLCATCAINWSIGISEPCQRIEEDSRAITGEGNCYFNGACGICKARGKDSKLVFKELWSSYPFSTWKAAKDDPTYLSREESMRTGNVADCFYIISVRHGWSSVSSLRGHPSGTPSGSHKGLSLDY